MNLNLGNLDLPGTPTWVLSVDGMAPEGPNLSHWPGNRTPANFKADLSTGICLGFAKAPLDQRLQFLDGATVVVNDHYDTDGFLSLLAVLQPEIALEREELLLEAAATGDYQSFHSQRGFAIDRIVLNLAGERSPIRGEFEGLSGSDKDHARYRWLLDHAVEILDHPEQFSSLYQDELDLVEQQLQDPTIACRNLGHCGLARITSPGPVHRVALNTLAGSCYRVLHTQSKPGATRYRYHDRTESWFEVQSFSPPPRLDMAILADELAAMEELTRADTGDTGTGGQWCLDPPDEPVPELYHGIPSQQAYGQISRALTPSGLTPDSVETLFTRFFSESS